jgi:hypothetical protein
MAGAAQAVGRRSFGGFASRFANSRAHHSSRIDEGQEIYEPNWKSIKWIVVAEISHPHLTGVNGFEARAAAVIDNLSSHKAKEFRELIALGGVAYSWRLHMGADVAFVVSLAVSTFVSLGVVFFLLFLSLMMSGKEWQEKARARRMAEHRMNARLLRLNL